MHFSDAITEYSFDCKVRKLSVKTISNYQKQLRYLQRYLEEEFKPSVCILELQINLLETAPVSL